MTVNGDFRRLMFTLAAAAIIGSWGFAATRASTDEVDENTDEIRRVESESRKRDESMGRDLREIRETVVELSTEQRAFRSRVLEAIRNGGGN